MPRLLTTLLGLAIIGGFAGCMTPDESTDDGLDDNGGDRGGDTPEYIAVDGAVYECDDQVDLDGVCEGYELNEGADASDARDVSAGAGGSLQIGGYSYVCDEIDNVDVDVIDGTDTAGSCERYERNE